MTAVCPEQSLLFGVLAVREGIIDPQKLDYVCRLWAVRRMDVADILQERSWLEASKRRELEKALEQMLLEHKGDAALALRAALDERSGRILKEIHHPSVRAVMMALDEPMTSRKTTTQAAPANGRMQARLNPSTALPRPALRLQARPRRIRRRLRFSRKGLVIAAAVLAVTALASFLTWEESARRRAGQGRAAAEGELGLALDALSTQVRRLAEEPMPIKVKQSTLRRDLLRRSRDEFEQIAKATGDTPAVRAARARAYTGMARVDLALGAARNGLAHAQTAIETLEWLDNDGADDTALVAALAEAQVTVGRACVETNQRAEAVKAFHAAAASYERLLQELGDRADDRRAMADMLVQLGELHRNSFDWAAASVAYSRARPLLEQLAEENPGALDIQQDLSVTLRGQYSVYNNVGNAAPAREALQKCIPLAGKLAADHPDVPECQFILARVLWSLSNSGLAQFEFQRRAGQCAIVAVAFGGSPAALTARAMVAPPLVNFCADVMHRGAAEWKVPLNRGVELARQLVKDEPDSAVYRQLLAYLRVALARQEAASGDPRQAAAAVEEALNGVHDGMVLFNASEVYALCGTFLDENLTGPEQTQRRERFAKRSVELLKKAREAGFPYRTDYLKNTPEYGWLADRDDFAKLDQVKNQ